MVLKEVKKVMATMKTVCQVFGGLQQRLRQAGSVEHQVLIPRVKIQSLAFIGCTLQ
jgi:hypothetical protein